ncbi:MAG: response regulator, partial [Bacteroidota bacterium]
IVEDEILIAELLARYVRQQGHEPVGIAATYLEAEGLFKQLQPDLVLLDVRLKGSLNGIDFANFLRQQSRRIPFIFLTSQTDVETMETATKLYPAGYLSKPIRPEDLRAAVSIALLRAPERANAKPSVPARAKLGKTLRILAGSRHEEIPLSNIAYLEASHVYVNVQLHSGRKLTVRAGLTALQQQLPANSFIRVHRSFIVNRAAIDTWHQQHLEVAGQQIPVSRGRWGEVVRLLEG